MSALNLTKFLLLLELDELMLLGTLLLLQEAQFLLKVGSHELLLRQLILQRLDPVSTSYRV